MEKKEITTFNFKNLFQQNSPDWAKKLGDLGLLCFTIGVSIAAASNLTEMFGPYASHVSRAGLIMVFVGGLIKQIMNAFGKEVKSN